MEEKLDLGLNVEKMKSSFPEDFCFNPTDKVIINDYLRKKAEGKALPKSPIRDADVYRVDPSLLLDSSGSSTENEDAPAYFFTKRKRQQHSSSEVTTNECMIWKPTSSAVQIADPGTGTIIGFKTKLACSIPESSSAKETHTKWIMKEYSLPTKRIKGEVKEEENQEEWVFCKIKRKKEHPQFEEAASSEEDDVVTASKMLGEDGIVNEGEAGALNEGIKMDE